MQSAALINKWVELKSPYYVFKQVLSICWTMLITKKEKKKSEAQEKLSDPGGDGAGRWKKWFTISVVSSEGQRNGPGS